MHLKNKKYKKQNVENVKYEKYKNTFFTNLKINYQISKRMKKYFHCKDKILRKSSSTNANIIIRIHCKNKIS